MHQKMSPSAPKVRSREGGGGDSKSFKTLFLPILKSYYLLENIHIHLKSNKVNKPVSIKIKRDHSQQLKNNEIPHLTSKFERIWINI